ncbi:MAG: S8 family serine peptidase [Phycisphaerae bacterium]|nr:S8 family serine peptidase [Phycisphaerae bacterium]
MKRIVATGLLISLAIAHAALAGGAQPGQAGNKLAMFDVEGGYASGHVLVRLKPGVRPGKLADGRLTFTGGAGNRIVAGAASAAMAQTLSAAKASAVTRLIPQFAYPQVAARLGLDRVYRLEVPAGTDTPALVRALAKATVLVESAELDGIGGVAGALPNDPELVNQFGMHNTGQMISGTPGLVDADIDAPEAWTLVASLGIDTSTVTIAVLDSGVNQHVQLAGRILPGFNVPQNSNDTTDVCQSHGTHVSGILAATGNDGVGTAGCAWSAKLTPYVVVNPCTGFESWVATALTLATDEGHRLVNMSLQYTSGTQALHDAVLYAAAADVIMVAATGNAGSGNVAYPAKWPETIAVAALTNTDSVASFSNFGPEVEFAAAGQNVRSLIGTTSYGDKNGTSQATPFVTGTIALMLARNPNLTAAEVRAILQATAVDINTPGVDVKTGYGRVNAAAAILATPSPMPADLDGDGSVGAADLALLLGAWGLCSGCDGECAADLDNDCIVGAADLAILLGSWG